MRYQAIVKGKLQQCLLLCMVVMLSACGFQLKGLIDVDDALKQVNIKQTQLNSSILKPLKRSFKANDINIVAASAANYQIVILDERQERRTSTVSSSNGVDEYELRLQVRFSVLNRLEEEVLAPRTLTLDRTYDYNANQETASSTEQALLQTEMAERIASQILRIYTSIKPAQ